MLIHIIAVGKIKDKYLQQGMAEYEKRLRPYVRLQLTEIPEEKRPVRLSPAQESVALEKEGIRIIAALDPGAIKIALDVTGERWESVDFARRLHDYEISGQNSIAFVIGGDLGLSPDVITRCDLWLSLSQMTFTHPMARLILLEQLYRACRINSGEPYHK